MKVLAVILCLLTLASPSFSQEESAPDEVIRILTSSPDFKLSFYRVNTTPADTDSSVFGVVLTLQFRGNSVGGQLNAWVLGQTHHFSLQLKDCTTADKTKIICKSSESEIPIQISVTRTERDVFMGLEASMLLILKAAKNCEPKAVNCAEEYVMTKDDIARFSNLIHVKNSQLNKLIEKELSPRMKK